MGHFGAVPGVQVGDRFKRRQDASDVGVHRETQAGICGTKERGCESVAVVGGYEDDIDDGDIIIYTGDSGRDRKTKKQVRDQELTSRNASLITNELGRVPVRVLRGSTAKGYAYGGLFFVEDHWYTRGVSGFMIWQYLLVAVDPLKPPASSPPPKGNHVPGRRGSYGQRVLRSARVAQWVKDVNNYTCQFCKQRYETPYGPYAETAHIKPLGGEHAGPDIVENALCLCPTHHTLFDLGAFAIDDDRMVIDVFGKMPRTPLGEVSEHRINIVYAEYQRALHPAPPPKVT